MKVFLLGHRGMLGHVVHRFLREQGLEVLTREERYTGSAEDKLLAAVRSARPDWVVNAAGKLDARTTSAGEMLLVNAQLPVHLKSFLRPGQCLIHASSDGVFSGKQGHYDADAERDATDIYGFSKILGEIVAERHRAWVIRTSVVGPARHGNKGLLSWFLAQKEQVPGFTNHFWNGITTLEWAKLCFELISGRRNDLGAIIQPACAEPVSKYHLLRTIGEVWHHPVRIEAAEHPISINRTLRASLQCAPLREQFVVLKQWYDETGTSG